MQIAGAPRRILMAKFAERGLLKQFTRAVDARSRRNMPTDRMDSQVTSVATTRRPYAPECIEGKFRELRADGVLRRSPGCSEGTSTGGSPLGCLPRN